MKERDGSRTRHRILKAIASSPGIHKSLLCRELALGWGTVGYHVRVLRAKGHVQARAQGRLVRLYPPDFPADDLRWLSLLQDDVCAGVLENLVSAPDQRLSDLARELGVSRRVMRRHLDALLAEGVVRPRGEFQRRYHVDAEAADALRPFLAQSENDRLPDQQEPDLSFWSALLSGDLPARR